MKHTIFIIEDEPDLLRIATDLLESDGYVVNSATNGVQALRKIRQNPPDLLLLDVRLPDMDGYQICKELKADPKTRHIPVIMVSVKSDETDVVVGLEVGADDYISKPFRQKELLARVKAALRRSGQILEGPKHVRVGPLELHTSTYTGFLNSKDIGLKPKEFEILTYFARMNGRVLTRTGIYETVWGIDFSGSSRTVDVHVEQIRKKLGPDCEDWITTLKGVGYRIQIDE